MTKVLNGNLIVAIGEQRTRLANGMSVQEQRGKKDVVQGTVMMSGQNGIAIGNKVWFPYYAALPIQYRGEYLHCVSAADVIIVEG